MDLINWCSPLILGVGNLLVRKIRICLSNKVYKMAVLEGVY